MTEQYSSFILQQRSVLISYLCHALSDLAAKSMKHWGTPQLEPLLFSHIQPGASLYYCKEIFVINADCRQSTLTLQDNALLQHNGEHHAALIPIVRRLEQSPNEEFALSAVFLDPQSKRSSLFALHSISENDVLKGYLVGKFELRDLPQPESALSQQNSWRQIKGDPSIRGQLFNQKFRQRAIDEYIDDVIDIMNEMICERGIFMGRIRFSSSMATVSLLDEPFDSRTHILDELLSPEICLAYPARTYPQNARISKTQVCPILEKIKMLRYIDDNIYLRSASINIINGVIELNFSCDGIYQMPFDEFLDKDESFWLWGGNRVSLPVSHPQLGSASLSTR